jgi:hypothetical protein
VGDRGFIPCVERTNALPGVINISGDLEHIHRYIGGRVSVDDSGLNVMIN